MTTTPAAARDGYVLEFEDTFDGHALDTTKWLPQYLPHWSSRAATATRYRIGDGELRLLIEEGQPPWCPEFDGDIRASVLQTALVEGQLKFAPGLVVREPQERVALYTPHYGLVEMRARAIHDPRCMVALWLMGTEDTPEQSGEICVAEIFGKDVQAGQAAVGMGVHPFGDPELRDEFAAEELAIDAREFHTYAAEWTPERVSFLVDGEVVKVVEQSPRYPMQLMLGIYEFPGYPDAEAHTRPYPKQFALAHVRGWRRE